MNLLGVRGVALAVSVSGVFQVTVLYALWNKRSNNTESRHVYAFYIKVMCFAVVLGIFLTWFKSVTLRWIDSSTFYGSLLVSLLTGAVFLVILLIVGYGLKIKEVTELANRLVKKVNRP